jgi:hypothetical protein
MRKITAHPSSSAVRDECAKEIEREAIQTERIRL